MELILLEKVAQLGDPGDLVKVKSGYGRNFLIPTGKAIRADEENKAEYEKRINDYKSLINKYQWPSFCCSSIDGTSCSRKSQETRISYFKY